MLSPVEIGKGDRLPVKIFAGGIDPDQLVQ
jgi:hypothetical protein